MKKKIIISTALLYVSLLSYSQVVTNYENQIFTNKIRIE